MEKLKQVFVIIATILTIFVNFLAANGYIGGVTPQVISEKYPTFVTPAGYAFAIWALIYSGLIIFSIYQALPKQLAKFEAVRTGYLVSCFANCLWIYFWHHEQILPSLFVMFLLLGSLVFVNTKLIIVETSGDRVFVKAPLNVYFGWVSVATIINFTIALLANGVQFSDLISVRIACGLVVIVTLLGIVIRWKLRNFLFSLVIAWALTAIAVKQNTQTMLILFAAFAVIISLITSLTIFLDNKKSEIS
jgi:translocator protein